MTYSSKCLDLLRFVQINISRSSHRNAPSSGSSSSGSQSHRSMHSSQIRHIIISCNQAQTWSWVFPQKNNGSSRQLCPAYSHLASLFLSRQITAFILVSVWRLLHPIRPYFTDLFCESCNYRVLYRVQFYPAADR